MHIRLLRDIALRQAEGDHTVVLISHKLTIPDELSAALQPFELSLPDRDKLRDAVLEEARDWSRRSGGRNVRTNRVHLNRLVDNLLGLPMDVRDVSRAAPLKTTVPLQRMTCPKSCEPSSTYSVRMACCRFEYDTSRFADVGGLARLQAVARAEACCVHR